MRSHVGSHGRRLREPAPADGTAERLFAGVRPNVRRQIGGLAEGLVTVLAAVRFFAGVRPQMGFQRAGSGVRFAADST